MLGFNRNIPVAFNKSSGRDSGNWRSIESFHSYLYSCPSVFRNVDEARARIWGRLAPINGHPYAEVSLHISFSGIEQYPGHAGCCAKNKRRSPPIEYIEVVTLRAVRVKFEKRRLSRIAQPRKFGTLHGNAPGCPLRDLQPPHCRHDVLGRILPDEQIRLGRGQRQGVPERDQPHCRRERRELARRGVLGLSRPSGGIGRRTGFKIPWGVIPVRVQTPPRPLTYGN